MTHVNAPHAGPVDYREVQQRDDFKELRKTHRSFVFPMTAFFLLWYIAFVIAAAFLPDFMAIKVWGNINLGLILGLAQFLTTFLITGLYVWFTNSKLDPKSSAIRLELEARGAGLPEEEKH
ncbi:DUF485 domain-containing protein [Nesterenkonia halotolerans]|uniref:DUF485 domain-containing protein n=1 Tax=Nesterenkonia halotolerans TaxID=225325 RepID=UPI003EE6B622